MINIDNEIRFHPLSSQNHLLWYEGQLLRSVNSCYYPILSKLLKLKNQYIQYIESTDYVYQNQYVFKHKIYQHRLRISEVPMNRARDFIHALISLQVESLIQGISLYDIHEANINDTIDGIKWLDYGGFEEATQENTLIAFSRICYFIFRYLLKIENDDHEHWSLSKITDNIFSKLVNLNWMDPYSWYRLLELVEIIEIPKLSGHWSDEYNLYMQFWKPETTLQKGINVSELLDLVKPKTITDIACNKGYHSLMAANKGIESVLGFDFEPCAKIAGQFRKLFSSLPVLFSTKSITDFLHPKMHEFERFSSELIMALAIVHHLENQLNHEQFADIITKLSQKYILIEDIGTAEIYQKLFEDRKFVLMKRASSSPEGRTISLYHKI